MAGKKKDLPVREELGAVLYVSHLYLLSFSLLIRE